MTNVEITEVTKDTTGVITVKGTVDNNTYSTTVSEEVLNEVPAKDQPAYLAKLLVKVHNDVNPERLDHLIGKFKVK